MSAPCSGEIFANAGRGGWSLSFSWRWSRSADIAATASGGNGISRNRLKISSRKKIIRAQCSSPGIFSNSIQKISPLAG